MSPHAGAPRIAVIGCGAIARSFHVPALVRHADVAGGLVFVDRDLRAAESLASEFGVGRTAERYSDVLADVDGVVVTVPHHLHYRVALDCLTAGKHVLCEKPLAEAPGEAREMVTAAAAAGVSLSVNHTRRLHPVMRRVRELVRDGAIGTLRRIEFFMGEKFDWPATTGFYFGVGGAPHGVLLDKGPHALDLICWWLGGKPDLVSCFDDSFGGGEAMSNVTLRRGDCVVNAYFSFLSRYPNTYTLIGDSGRIEGSLSEFVKCVLVDAGGRRKTIKASTAAATADAFGAALIDNFLAVMRGAAQPLISGADVLDSVVLIDECYRSRQRFSMPWHDTWSRVANV